MDRPGFIYLLTNLVNGKHYVGKTHHKSISHRWREHCWSAADHHGRMPISAAIREVGPQMFHVTQLADAETKEDLTILEKQFILLYDSKNPECGYNLTSGGNGAAGLKRSADDVRQLSERAKKRWANPEWRAATMAKMRGVPVSPEVRKKISDAHKAKNLTGERSHRFGIKASVETSAKMSVSRKKLWQDPQHRELQTRKHLGHKPSPQTLERMSIAAQRQSDPARRKAMSVRITEWWRQRKEKTNAV